MGFYSALKTKEILTYATTGMNPEDIMLSEISQSQEDKRCVICCMRYSQSNQIHRGRQNGGCQRQWESGGWGAIVLRV